MRQKKTAEFDAYIFIAAEYNRGPTAVLKNALDYAYHEWSNKPVSFVGYGAVGGARAVEQLRLNAIELQMAPIRTAVHVLLPTYLAVAKEGKKLIDFDFLNQRGKDMLDQVSWWTNALQAARHKVERAAQGCRMVSVMNRKKSSKELSNGHEHEEEWSEVAPGERVIIRTSSAQTNGTYSMLGSGGDSSLRS